MESITKQATTSATGQDQLLNNLLEIVANYYSGMVKDTSDSHVLLKEGIKTQQTQHLERIANDPLRSLIDARGSIDLLVKKVVNGMVSDYLKAEMNIVSKAVLADTGDNTLFYCIALKKDNLQNRMKLNRFFSIYDDEHLSALYPVLFSYVPATHIEDVKTKQQIV